MQIRSAIQMKTGLSLTVAKDDTPDEGPEILLGMCDRPSCTEARTHYDAARVNQDTGVYLLMCVGEDIVLMGDSARSTQMAVDLLIGDYLGSSGDAVFPGDLLIVKTYSISAYEEEEAQKELQEKPDEVFSLMDQLNSADFGQVTPLSSTAYPAPSVYPTEGQHPRVMFNGETLQEIRGNLTANENRYAYAAYLERAEQSVTGILPAVTESTSKHANYDTNVLAVIEAKAFRYALTGEELYGYQAILAIQNFIRTLEIQTAPEKGASDYMGDVYRAYGYTMYMAAQVYDWCYDLLTPADRQRIVAGIESLIAPHLEVGFPPSGQGAIVGHGSEAQLLRDWLSFAIATYDEYPDLYTYVMGRIESEYVPARNFYYASGMHSQGNSYGPYRFTFELTSLHLYRTMCGKELYAVDMGEVARSFIHNLRPDGTLLRIGDDTNQRGTTFNLNNYGYCLFYAAAICNDPVAKSQARWGLQNFSKFSYNDQSLSCVQFLILNDPDLTDSPLETLPLAIFNGTPVGQIIARTSWTDPDAAMLYMKIGEYFAANHEHKDVGSFQIFYGGILASDSGFYDTYGSEVDTSYTKSTLAHNSLLIYDPDENTGSQANVGGQKADAGESPTLESWLGRDYTRRADVLGYAIRNQEDGSLLSTYLSGDLTAAYNAEKADEVVRYMLGFFTGDSQQPLVFFVFDKITADSPDYRKTFLLHCEEMPTVEGNRTVITHDGGVLVNQTLLPGADQLEITVVEGSYVIDGENPEINRYNDQNPPCERGWGRIEISPTTGRNTDYLLNVMYVTADGQPTDSVALEYENADLAGASLLGYAAFFSKTVERIAHRTTVCAYGEGETLFTVAGIAAGAWEVYSQDGTLLQSVTVTDEAGILEFTAEAGTYVLLPEGGDFHDIPGDGAYPDPYGPAA